MDAQQFTQLLRNLCLPVELELQLAILHASGKHGVTTISGQDMINAQQSHEQMNYEAMAEFVNRRLAGLERSKSL